MGSDIKFYLDENIAHSIAAGLRRRKVDVLTVNEAETLGEDDKEHLDIARKKKRIIVTHDVDFLRLASNKSDHAGIVFAPQSRGIGAIVRKLTFIAQILTAEEMKGHIEFI